jgi:hypothetical protein
MSEERDTNQEDLEISEEEAENVQGGFAVPGAPAAAAPRRAEVADRRVEAEPAADEEIRRLGRF